MTAQRLADTLVISVPERNRTRPHGPDDHLRRALEQVHRDLPRSRDLYELADKLVNLEDDVHLWRFNHVTTVERVIGMKRGTGGTGGASYPKRMLEVELFPDLWHLRTAL